MLAAEIWHWWIGVLITLGVIAGLVAMIALYLKSVTAKKYEPGSSKRRRQSADELPAAAGVRPDGHLRRMAA